jgi:rhodanese-related sulfurtransferase
MNPLLALSNAHPAGFREIPPEGASAHLGAFQLIDVREPDEYVGPLGHVPGSTLIPLGQVLDAASSWDRSRPILLICRSGARSGRACEVLSRMGFSQMYNLIGGMLVWNELDLPVSREPTGTP